MNALLVKHSGQSMDKIKLDTERDHFLGANEAKDYGLIDEVLVDRQTLPMENTIDRDENADRE